MTGSAVPPLKVHGPCSWKRPIKELQPGPPLSQRVSGAFLGSLRDSKNQKNMWLSVSAGAASVEPRLGQFGMILTNIDVSRVLVDAGCGLTDARVLHVSQLGIGGSVLMDIVGDAVVGGGVALVELANRGLATGSESEESNCRFHIFQSSQRQLVATMVLFTS